MQPARLAGPEPRFKRPPSPPYYRTLELFLDQHRDLFQDLKILLLPSNSGNDWSLDNLRMASGFRSSLLCKADEVFSATVCLKHLLTSFATVLQVPVVLCGYGTVSWGVFFSQILAQAQIQREVFLKTIDELKKSPVAMEHRKWSSLKPRFD